MVQLTKMQQRIYDYIAQTIRTQGYPPSVREIGDAVGLKSPSTVHFHLKHMEELGDEATVKRYSRRNGQVWLLPENEAYSPIDGHDAQILGKVAAVIRRY